MESSMLPRPHVTSAWLAKRKKKKNTLVEVLRVNLTATTNSQKIAWQLQTQETRRQNLNPPPLSLKSPVWKYFGFPVSYVDNVRVVDKKNTVCKLCYVRISHYSTGSTTNMAGHLRRHHKNIDLSVKPTSVTQTTLPSSFGIKLPSNSTRAKAITSAVGVFIAADMRPYSVVENSGFRHLISVLEPRYEIPSRTHLTATCFLQLRMSKEMEELSPLGDSGHGGGSEEETEEDDEPKICQVCGDKSTGYHFNAMTCEGCKGFFRRAMKRPAQLCCPFQNACVITKTNRRQCQSCRLQKCLSIGMKRELIMSDEAVEKRRMQIRRKRMQEEPVMLSPQQETVIQELLSAHHKTFDMTCANFVQFRPLDRDQISMSEYGRETDNGKLIYKPPPEDAMQRTISCFSPSSPSSSFQSAENKERKRHKSTIFTSLPHFADLTTHMIKNIINFSKTLAMFRALIIEDQIALLKGATFEIILIHFNMFFNEVTGIWECGPVQYCLDDAMRVVFPHYTRSKEETDNTLTDKPEQSSASLLHPDSLPLTLRGCKRGVRAKWPSSEPSPQTASQILIHFIPQYSGFQRHLLDPMMNFHYALRKLHLREEEYVLMQAISLFSPDRPGVTHHSEIDRYQEIIAVALKTYIEAKRNDPEKHLLYPKIMACLTEMRTMNEEYTKQVLKIQDIQPDVSPLLLEIISKDC
ncbi:Nuclear receptor subfamily 1 group I member 2 [Labeo rohita]|uniref:Nuclear receptor subfamily 1 group I member 2 n=1 Tax=Labeo rohita TaxID=84645 RepID=A0ABQ8MC45_LABRO|nr:Nuclear receptor subfamily 1 group I member 2 [Labeo rohita]